MEQSNSHQYRLLERIGTGDLFTVSKARDNAQNRLVALKMLRPEMRGDSVFVSNVRRGYNRAKELRHPCIASVYGVSGESHEFLAVSEYVPGGNIKTYLRHGGAFGITPAVDIACSVLDALSYAHSLDIVHGDLRPQDILVTADGDIKVTDFGLAEAIRKSSTVKQRYGMRSVYYQAPELAAGNVADKRADVYSVGAILYEMLTGVVPFPGDTAVSVVLKQVASEAVEPRAVNAAIPKSLSDAVMKALSKNPEDRYFSAGAMLSDLRAIQRSMRGGRSADMPKPTSAPKQPSSARSVSVEEEEEYYPESGLKASLFGLIALFVLVTVVMFFISMKMMNKTDDITIPDVMGMTREEARRTAAEKGIQFIDEGEEPSENYEIGRVCSEVPPGGTRVEKSKAKIQVKFSSGVDRRVVPDLVGLGLRDAKDSAESEGFEVEVKTRYDDDVKKGMVITQTPAADTRVKPDTKMTIFVSKGPKPEERHSSYDYDDEEEDDTAPGLKIIHTSVPSSVEEAQEVRIEVEDARGTRDEYNRYHEPGEDVRVEVPTYGKNPKIRVYVGGTLQEQN